MRRKRRSAASATTDIAFLLLLFFLIMAISSRQTPVPIEPAKASFDELSLQDFPTLIVSQKGELFLDGNRTTLEQIPIQDTYVLLSDKNTQYEYIHDLITYLKKGGVETLYCLVEGET